MMEGNVLLRESSFSDEKQTFSYKKKRHRKTWCLKNHCSISNWEILCLVILVSLMFAQGTAFARKAKKYSKLRPECDFIASDWTECSKPCDMGVSTRELTAGSKPLITPKCKSKTETRLCMISPCDEARFRPPIKGKSRCMRMFRSKAKERLEYAGGVSEKSYKMRYCGVCEDRRKCCTPSKSKTRKVRFRRKDGTKFNKQVAFIRKCKCHRKCPTSRSAFIIPLRGDMEREEKLSTRKQMNAIAGSRSVVKTT